MAWGRNNMFLSGRSMSYSLGGRTDTQYGPRRMTPTQRTLKLLREQGRVCGIVERFNYHGGEHGVRQDLFGFLDIVCIDPDLGIIGVQSCGQAFSEHVKKITDNDILPIWLRHARVELVGWRKVVLRRGSTAVRWRPRIMDFWLENDMVLWQERR
jgi:hypothetical protein